MIRLAVRVARDRAEQALAELLELAPAGVEEVQLDDHRVEYAVYGPPGELPSLPDLKALAGDTPIEVSTSEIADDWDERWKDFHRPVLIEPSSDRDAADPGDTPDVPSLLIRPPWEPAPQAGGHLGIHMTVDLAGAARFGPDTEWVDSIDYAVDPSRAALFAATVRQYWPGIDAARLYPAYAGIRPKILKHGEVARDFYFSGPQEHGIAGVVNLFGMDSPGLTASLAIGEDIAAMAD